jgi:predicted nucleic acid-binding protein
MGLILDSSVVIAAERRGDTVEKLIEQAVAVAGDQDAALSSIGLTELVPRNLPRTDPEDAASPRILHRRNAPRCDGLSYTKETAMLAGKIDGEQQAKGVTVPFGDLLIGHGALALASLF